MKGIAIVERRIYFISLTSALPASYTKVCMFRAAPITHRKFQMRESWFVLVSNRWLHIKINHVDVNWLQLFCSISHRITSRTHSHSHILKIDGMNERQWHYNLFMIRFGALNRCHCLRRRRRWLCRWRCRLQSIGTHHKHKWTMEKCDFQSKDIRSLFFTTFAYQWNGWMHGRRMRWMIIVGSWI